MTISYQPFYRVHGTTTWIPFGSPISATTVTITGLVPSTSYDFEVQAVNQTGTSTSNIVQQSTLGGVTFTSINLNPQTFTAGSNTGTAVGTISVGMSSGSFTGNLTLGGTDAAFFQIVSGVLQLAVNNTTARTYNISITASQPGVTNLVQPFALTGNPASLEAGEGFAITATGITMNASTTMGSPDVAGPWLQFTLTAGQQVNLLAPGQSLITTTSGGVVKILYHNHTCYQQNNAVPAGWWYWNTSLTFGPSNWTEYGVNVLTVTPQTYTLNAGIGTQVATMSVTMKDGNAFNGTFTVTDPSNSFTVVGSAVKATKILNLTSYPTVQITAIPAITTDGSATPVGEQASQTLTINQTGSTILVPLGIHINTTFTNSWPSHYANDAAHWTGVVNGFGRTPSLIGAVGSNANADPSNWPGIAQFNLDNWPSTAPTNLAVLLHWQWEDAGGPAYANIAANTSYAGTTTANWINQSLDKYRLAGRNPVYIRPNWEWNQNGPAGNGWAIDSGSVGAFLNCWRFFANTVHTYQNNHSGFVVKMVWGPACDGGPGVNLSGGSNGLTLAQQFASPDGSAVNGKYIDVVGADTYSFGQNLVSHTDSSTVNFVFDSCVKLGIANGCTIASSEIGGTVDVNGASPATWIADAVQYFKNLGTTTPIEYLCFWDVMTPPGLLEFTHPSSLNYPISLNGWKAGVTAGGTNKIMTLPAP